MIALTYPFSGSYGVSNPYGAPSDRYVRGYHPGVDFAMPEGTPVYAAAPGAVTFTGDAGAYGGLVTVSHGGGVETLYAHLSRFAVFADREQPQVATGTLLGYSGNTGLSTGPHLHFEARENGEPVDPTPYLSVGNNLPGGTPTLPPGTPPEQPGVAPVPFPVPVLAVAALVVIGLVILK